MPLRRRLPAHGTVAAETSAYALQRRGPGRVLRQVPGRPGREPQYRAAQDHRAHRPVGLRQEHGAALLQPHERPDPDGARRGHRGVPRPEPLRAGRGPGRSAPPHRHGLPEAQPVPQEHLRERRLGREDQRLPRQHGRAGGAIAAAGRAVGRREGQAEPERAIRSPAGSSSACASRAPSPSRRTSS